MTRAAIVHDNGKTAMQVFAENYVRNGSNATQAAIIAGYSEKTARAMGSKLLQMPKVQAEIRRYQMRYLGGELANTALAVLRDIMVDVDAPASARVESAKTVLDRAGISKAAVLSDSGKLINEMTEEELIAIINGYSNKNNDLEENEKDITAEGEVLPELD